MIPGGRELLAELRRRGIKTVLATSSNKEQIELVEKNTGLHFVSMFDAMTSADDADSSKPAPDLIHAAVKKMGMTAAQCAMIGDTPYDAEACRNAGVVCLGVLSGQCHTREQIRAGGAWHLPRHCGYPRATRRCPATRLTRRGALIAGVAGVVDATGASGGAGRHGGW